MTGPGLISETPSLFFHPVQNRECKTDKDHYFLPALEAVGGNGGGVCGLDFGCGGLGGVDFLCGCC